MWIGLGYEIASFPLRIDCLRTALQVARETSERFVLEISSGMVAIIPVIANIAVHAKRVSCPMITCGQGGRTSCPSVILGYHAFANVASVGTVLAKLAQLERISDQLIAEIDDNDELALIPVTNESSE